MYQSRILLTMLVPKQCTDRFANVNGAQLNSHTRDSFPETVDYIVVVVVVVVVFFFGGGVETTIGSLVVCGVVLFSVFCITSFSPGGYVLVIG